MHPDHLLWPVSLGSQFGNRNRRGVRRQDGRFRQDAVEGAKELRLHFEALRCGFNGNVCAGEGLAVQRRLDAGQSRFNFGLGQLALGGFAAQVGANLRDGPAQEALLHVAQQHAKARAGKDMGDAGAHGSRTHHPNRLNFCHGKVLPKHMRECSRPKEFQAEFIGFLWPQWRLAGPFAAVRSR